MNFQKLLFFGKPYRFSIIKKYAIQLRKLMSFICPRKIMEHCYSNSFLVFPADGSQWGTDRRFSKWITYFHKPRLTESGGDTLLGIPQCKYVWWRQGQGFDLSPHQLEHRRKSPKTTFKRREKHNFYTTRVDSSAEQGRESPDTISVPRDSQQHQIWRQPCLSKAENLKIPLLVRLIDLNVVE